LSKTLPGKNNYYVYTLLVINYLNTIEVSMSNVIPIGTKISYIPLNRVYPKDLTIHNLYCYYTVKICINISLE